MGKFPDQSRATGGRNLAADAVSTAIGRARRRRNPGVGLCGGGGQS